MSQTLPHGAGRFSQPLSKSGPSFCQCAFDVRAEVTAPFHLLGSQKGHEAGAGAGRDLHPASGLPPACGAGKDSRVFQPLEAQQSGQKPGSGGPEAIGSCEHRAWVSSAPAWPSPSPLHLWFPEALEADSRTPSQGAICLAQLRPLEAGQEPGAPWFRSPLFSEGDQDAQREEGLLSHPQRDLQVSAVTSRHCP